MPELAGSGHTPYPTSDVKSHYSRQTDPVPTGSDSTNLPIDTDVLIVGGGPSGASVAAHLARDGHSVVVVEKQSAFREKSCGDALTPRALVELGRLGVDPIALGGHAVDGIRMTYGRRHTDVSWPEHADLPTRGVVLQRNILDEELRSQAEGAGALVLMGHEATAPISERGFVRGATVALTDSAPQSAGEPRANGRQQEIRARFVVVADGANSRFGRGLGTSRQRNWPYAIAARTYFESPRHADTWAECALGLPDPNGNPITGYGWVTPMGADPRARSEQGGGMVNVGVSVLSSYRDIKGVNTLKLLDEFCRRVAEKWQLDPASALKAPTRLRLPMGGSVRPKMGPTFLVVGDAAGAANPFSGDGVDAALMGARLAADVLDEALTTGNSTTLQRYPLLLTKEVEQYRKVGRLSARFLGRPSILKPALRFATRSDAAMGAALRIATNELRDGNNAGGAERAYKLATVIARFAPSW